MYFQTTAGCSYLPLEPDILYQIICKSILSKKVAMFLDQFLFPNLEISNKSRTM
jgi:hypothetical protein